MNTRFDIAAWGAFAGRLARLLHGGVPLLEALAFLAARGSAKERAWYEEVQLRLQAGHPLSDSIKRGEAPLMMQALVEVGEHGGDLAGSLLRSADYCAEQVKWRRERRQAMLYPLLVGAVLVFLSLFLFGVVVPRFAELYAGMGLEVQGATRLLFGLSEAYPLLLGALFAALGTSMAWKAGSKKGRGTSSLLPKLERVPFLRRLLLVERTHEWVATLGLLLDGGVPLVQALYVQERLPLREENRSACVRIRDKVLQGSPLGDAVECEQLDAALPLAIGVAEVTGELSRALLAVERELAEQRRQLMSLMIKALEPILLLIAGLFVGLVALLMMWPMLNLIQSI
ncbi:type II secretion system protein F (GspF) [Tumebacillus sp. BK434]|uniref:type II secretion system F family protein n=1 Tax=Tumebacillus sp. BK434 TaxID=2512169 RepID=UPI0010CEE360|nr:type II secretion system F family protein [Tumebacillus sp. BK434]TCP59650.1 type II secretion system protein F (GspF) [Tumebacillus sp. BK434]